uniref:Uncharacterized protein n=1 Tax=Arundo donax TaxID=35708 RepID=A0A0A9A957_ARUDO
MTVHYLTG